MTTGYAESAAGMIFVKQRSNGGKKKYRARRIGLDNRAPLTAAQNLRIVKMELQFTPSEFANADASNPQESAMQMIHEKMQAQGSHLFHEWKDCKMLRGYMKSAVDAVAESIKSAEKKQNERHSTSSAIQARTQSPAAQRPQAPFAIRKVR